MAHELNDSIVQQGNLVRDLKAQKAEKAKIDEAVKSLLGLKAEYKAATGQDWKPGTVPPAATSEQKPSSAAPANGVAQALNAKIAAQGNSVRDLKAQKADKSKIDEAVKGLLALKAEYKEATGQEWKPEAGAAPARKPANAKAAKEQQQPKVTELPEKGKTRLGLEATKEENLPEWYSQILTKSELIEYYDVSGCYILRHWSFAIWKFIQTWFTEKIDALGVKEVYFPLFVSRSALEKEKTHIADFSPEVAWVTKSGDSDLAEPVAIRPTSETVMYPAFAKWVQSYRDLPIRINQWSNVVRWEFKHPQPFLRTREFLWQEGHTAYEKQADACEEVDTILGNYINVQMEMFA